MHMTEGENHPKCTYLVFNARQCLSPLSQVYLVSFAVQWNNRMESLKVAGGQGRRTTCVDPRQIQRLNQQAEILFGKEHLFEPNFVAPMPFPDRYEDPEEEELLGVEYAYCQSTDFSSREYYIGKGEIAFAKFVNASSLPPPPLPRCRSGGLAL